MKTLKFLPIFMISILIFSCAITQRKYLPGYNVQYCGRANSFEGKKLRFSTSEKTTSEWDSVNKSKSLISQPDFHDVLLFNDTVAKNHLSTEINDSINGDTIIVKKRLCSPLSEKIFCKIDSANSTKVFYTKNNVSGSVLKRKVIHTNVSIYKKDEVERLAKRSKTLTWIGILCAFPGILLLVIPFFIAIPILFTAERKGEQAMDEINKNPDKYSSQTKKQARFGKKASEITLTCMSIFWTLLTIAFIIFFIYAIAGNTGG